MRHWGKQGMRGVAEAMARGSDLLLAGVVVGIVAMMIVPLPTVLLDMLLTTNITVAVVLLLVSMYVTDALSFSAFPTLLLITTLFRLALNVSSTRLILLQADAGEVIDSFGNFVVAGNYIVGAVVFLILTLIQFLVIAKGSERVAEVAARFTLDAMPGKQMSIDADLRAGNIDHQEARRRRGHLQRESQLYGSMDGAMKFVKGDAIAGIIISMINIMGGLIIGVAMEGMEAGQALRTYSILTIGDGLVSQIPALLISTAAGLVVTRVASEEEGLHLGKEIGRQILGQPKAIAIAAGLLFLLAVVPGLPTGPFMVMALLAGGASYALFRARRPAGEGEASLEVTRRLAEQTRRETEMLLPLVPPLALEMGERLAQEAGALDQEGSFLAQIVPRIREGIFYELGVRLPGVRVRVRPGAERRDWMGIRLFDVPIHEAALPWGQALAGAGVAELAELGVAAAAEPAAPFELRSWAWVAEGEAGPLRQAGIAVWDAKQCMATALLNIGRRHAEEFVGIQEVRLMLDQLEGPYPALVAEVVPKLVSLTMMTDILKRLISEGVSIRDMRQILQALAESAAVDKDVVVLTERVRVSLRRQITHRHTGRGGAIAALLLDPLIEQTVRESIRQIQGGSYLAIEPEVGRDILQALGSHLRRLPPSAPTPCVLTSTDIRRYVKRLVELEFPALPVLAFQELLPTTAIVPLARVGLLQEGAP